MKYSPFISLATSALVTSTSVEKVYVSRAKITWGEDGFNYLKGLSESSDPENRIGAAAGLGAFPSAATILILSNMLSDSDGMVRYRALRSACYLKEPLMVPALYPVMNDPEFLNRYMASVALFTIGDDSAKRALLCGLTDKDKRVRRRVKQALSGIVRKRSELQDLFQKHLHDADPMIKLGAAAGIDAITKNLW